MNPIPTEEVCLNYNDLRNEIVLLNELKAACSSSDFELQTLKHQYETLNPDGVCELNNLKFKSINELLTFISYD